MTQTMFRLLTATAVAGCVAVLGQTPVSAAIISVDTGFGADTATRDTDSGLDWLDLTQSFGALADIEARLAVGGDLEGWRLATQADVATFWNHAGIAPTSLDGNFTYTTDAGQVAATLTLFDLVGGTQFNASLDQAFGYTAESVSDSEQAAAALVRLYNRDLDIFDETGAILGAAFPKTPSVGNAQAAWLIRDAPAVPAPGALGLLGLGALALAARRRA
ncbi:MAG: PEP-CTERM sorting domain-containing protein [Pacificimonas sp.]